LAFSPGGRLLAKAGRKNWLLFTEPWQTPIAVPNDPRVKALDVAWIDEKRALVAGTVRDRTCIAVLKVAGRDAGLRIVHEGPRLTTWVESGACAPSGLVAFLIAGSTVVNNACISYANDGRIVLYQLSTRLHAVRVQWEFSTDRHEFASHIKVSEDGSTILRVEWGADLDAFDRRGQRKDTLKNCCHLLHMCRPVYRHATLCVRQGPGSHERLNVYQVRDHGFQLWCSRPASWALGGSVDVARKDGALLLAVVGETTTEVFELVDYDIVKLADGDPSRRQEAARSLGARRFSPALQPLVQRLGDEAPAVQGAVVNALAEIGVPEALLPLIHALGEEPATAFRDQMLGALDRFDRALLVNVVTDCLGRVLRPYRRGAARVLENRPSIEALDLLCAAVYDVDHVVQLSAARALMERRELGAFPALLGCLADPNAEVRTAVQEALTASLDAAGLLPGPLREQLTSPLDPAEYARQVIANGPPGNFEVAELRATGEFLSGLAACIGGDRPGPEVLDVIGKLTTPRPDNPHLAPTSIGLAVALVCADALRVRGRWREAADVYLRAVGLARRLWAPRVEWRAWSAVGECREAYDDDPGALTAYRRATEIIDRLWLDVLEEDTLRHFFRDKALLYDRAAWCALRQKDPALALEFAEKAKTRYLVDLIARRQKEPQVQLQEVVRELWRHGGTPRPVRVPIGTAQAVAAGSAIIVAVEWATASAGTPTIKPERLAAYEEAVQDPSHHRLRMLSGIWRLMAYLSVVNDESSRHQLEEIYQSLRQVHRAIRTGSGVMPATERAACFARYNAAADLLHEWCRVRRDAPFSVFSEYRESWIEDVLDSRTSAKERLLLEAVLEALNSVLGHEPVHGIRGGPREKEGEGPVFLVRDAAEDLGPLDRRTAVIESALERSTQTEWRYLTRLARGEVSRFADLVDGLDGRAGVAHVQFTLTEHGTVVYLVRGRRDTTGPWDARPGLDAGECLKFFPLPDVTISYLQQLLVKDEDSWSARYRERRQAGGLEAWKGAMRRTLKELHARLVVPLEEHLAKWKWEVKRLRIVPHRALHLIPFAALYRCDSSNQPHYLIDDYDVSYAPSATLQQVCRQRAGARTARSSLTAIANPSHDLRFAVAEVEGIRALFPATDPVVPGGTQGGVADFSDLRPGSFFHLACHASYDWSRPLASALLLSDRQPLALHHLFEGTLPLSETVLATLSACETGVTDPADLADEYIGLAAGFLFAGVPCVVSSLWAVNDLASMLLMREFYRRVLDAGASPAPQADPDLPEALSLLPRAASAMQQSQNWLRRLGGRQVAELLGTPLLARVAEEVWRAEGRILYDPLPADPLKQLEMILGRPVSENRCPFEDPYYWAPFTVVGAL
jgi:CHAT domain-containing protein